MNNHMNINNNNMLDPHIRPNYTVPNYFNNYLNPYSLQKSLSLLQQQAINQEFASLPPSVNLNHTNQSSNSTTVDHQVDGIGGFQDLLNVDFGTMPGGRRFSDPGGLAGNSDDNESKDEGDASKKTTPNGEHTRRTDGKTDDKKMMATLLEQINILHETNSKICKNLHETKG